MIKSHKELAEFIAGKKILHMNSLGKDSAVCLEWLTTYAHPKEIHSLFFKRLAFHPGDDPYLNYQRRRYPGVIFHVRDNGNEVTDFPAGVYADPIQQLRDHNAWDYIAFSMQRQADEIRANLGCDFICSGFSKYESVSRAVKFHNKGLVQDDRIFPIGMMTKADVINIIKSSGMKLHPVYKLAQSTMDHLSYYKMRSSFIAYPEYRDRVMGLFPLMELDAYRWEKLL